MQFSTFLVAAVAATASAAVIPRDDQPEVFDITNFSASGSPHSLNQYYYLDVTDGTDAGHCSTTTSVFPGIGTFTKTPCGTSPYSFSLTSAQQDGSSGYMLAVIKQVSEGTLTGCRWFNGSDVYEVQDPNNPNGDFWRLDAPEAFDLTPALNTDCACN